MSEIWIGLLVVAVVASCAVFLRRRGKGRSAKAGAAGEPPEASPRRAPVEAHEPDAVATAPRGFEVDPVAAPASPPVAEAEPAAKREPSERELRSRVKARLEESQRMLAELRKAAEHDQGIAQQAGAVEILEEGLEEVRSLAEGKHWSQAKDKGEALHAQLALILQSARRDSPS